MHIALYARVSTARQAENDLSIPDQLQQMRQWAERNGHVVVKEYIEPGASATDERRPIFQDMMLVSEQKPALFQLVVVHSLSRFFRDLVQGALYERKLQKAGIKLISITQQTSDDSSGEMQRHMFMLFDQYQSRENAKHTLRGMQENARQGYFNGSKAPYGYQTIDAGQTGNRGRMKKKLAINPTEAEVVRDIFILYIHGKNGPRIGIKEIAKTLNANGILNRGKLWRIQTIHLILSSTTYAGWHIFNRVDSKTMKRKAEAEWTKIPVPAIIDQDTFDQATRLRRANTPVMCAPRRATSPNLLTGILKCDCCGSSMVMITAKNNRYRYYKCSNRLSKGNTACQSGNYPMDQLDNFIIGAFKHNVYTSEHIRTIIDELRGLANRNGGENKYNLKKLEAEIKDIDRAETKLYEGVEMGILELNDRLKARIQQHKTRREAITAELATLHRKCQTPLQTLTPQKIDAATRVLNKRFSTSTPFSRAYMRATVEEIRIKGDQVKLRGMKNTMASLVAADGVIGLGSEVHRFVPHGTPLWI